MILACPQFRSAVNLSRIVRLAGCAGIERMVVCGRTKVDPRIARDGADHVELERRNSLPPVLRKLKASGACIVGLEQTDDSHSLFDYTFARNTVLVGKWVRVLAPSAARTETRSKVCGVNSSRR